ncbi:MAG: sel1 repeat family protein [Proteobacteria bacterium]|nr:sel1 repeat family protein [Pseudomonadota bacterium]
MNIAETHDLDAVSRGIVYWQKGAYVQAYIALLPLAEAGDGDAQCLVGAMLAAELGGLPRNPVNAVKWLDVGIRCPDTTNTDGMRQIYADLMRKLEWRVIGLGRFRAFRWQQAFLNATNGDPAEASPIGLAGLNDLLAPAAFQLGADFNQGHNGPIDYEKAFLCFKQAAKFDLPEAVYNVALSYYAGKGVRGDAVRAIRWFDRASDLGFAAAAVMRALMSVRGHGVPADRGAAARHFQRAIDLGHEDAKIMAEALAQGSDFD